MTNRPYHDDLGNGAFNWRNFALGVACWLLIWAVIYGWMVES